jgi:hypothetical protein
MIFTQYYLDCLSQASYLVGDESTGRAVGECGTGGSSPAR